MTELSVPKVIKDYCEIYSGESGIDGIRMDVYKWSGTDRVSILWIDCTKQTRPKTIGKCEMYYTELYPDIGGLLKDREYITKVMQEQKWGVLDLRDMTAVREFTEDFH